MASHNRMLMAFLFVLPSCVVSCSQPIHCRYSVGDRVKIHTGDVYTVMEANKGFVGEIEPRYKLMTKGAVWNLSFGGSGAALSNVYWAKESEIAGLAEEGAK